ncbi:hypothetical protein B0H17DRAFT_1132383 [Mycena rosella]|uniref:Transmembrane protein n=1 Tax=Mycena rosella TaxID=1033263 RepID=A0AAD7GJD9_MYCRO|nr:hypothetical protein B0H17DRAFT_1132383 [Mycena rosella]
MLFSFSFVPLFFWFLATQAALVNITIDDTTGDSLTGALVTYTPPDAWESGDSRSSANSAVRPDTTQLEGTTWHDSTFSVNVDRNLHPNVPLTASVSFNGSAVYVFCARATGNSDMSFYLDGVLVGSFAQPALGSGFDYRVPVYANPAIPPGPHAFTIQNGHENGYTSLMILDSIVYSYDTDSTAIPAAQSSALPGAAATVHSNQGVIVAVAAVLIAALLALFVGLWVFLYRRRRRRRAVYARYMPEGAVEAFPSFLAPSRVTSAASTLAPLPPAYGGSGDANRWAGRDQKSRDGPSGIASHRPYADLDPSQAGLQRPQGWERTSA